MELTVYMEDLISSRSPQHCIDVLKRISECRALIQTNDSESLSYAIGQQLLLIELQYHLLLRTKDSELCGIFEAGIKPFAFDINQLKHITGSCRVAITVA